MGLNSDHPRTLHRARNSVSNSPYAVANSFKAISIFGGWSSVL